MTILMGIRIPGCNGLEATRLIEAEMPQSKVIILTACDDDAYFSEAIKSGADGRILKPFGVRELLVLLS